MRTLSFTHSTQTQSWLTLSVILLYASPTLLFAQGLLVNVDPNVHVRLPRPNPPRPDQTNEYTITSLQIDAVLEHQIARVTVAQTFKNTGPRRMEVCFMFPLPYDGAIDRMTLLIDGVEHPAELMPAQEARSMYESIVRKNKDPALLEWIGTGLFKTSVFPVPPGASRTISLRYTQVCPTFDGVTDFLVPLTTARYTRRAIPDFRLSVSVTCETALKNLYSPSHDVTVTRQGSRRSTIAFHRKHFLPERDFRLLYDTGTQPVSAKLLSYRPKADQDGYFMLLTTPEIRDDAKSVPKDIIFVIDRSGSMRGRKLEQARESLHYVLNNLREGDRFNIIAYDNETEVFRNSLQTYDSETRTAAEHFVSGLRAGGSTNIDSALQRAFTMLTDHEKPSYILFLTDGRPTAGEKKESVIVKNMAAANTARTRLYAFGVGYNVNSRLLDGLARTNYGQVEYVRPDADIERAVSSLYSRIEAPVLTNASIRLADGDTTGNFSINRMFPGATFDLFAGQQLVMVGRYAGQGTAPLVLEGHVGDTVNSYAFDMSFSAPNPDGPHAYIARIWAIRRIGQIVDLIDLQGKNEELLDELMALATEHGVVTPYTSFLADENQSLDKLSENKQFLSTHLAESVRQSSGQLAFGFRAQKNQLRNALGVQTLPNDSAPNSPAPTSEGLGRADVHDTFTVAPAKVRRLAGKTFYWKAGRWIDASVRETEAEQAVPTDRYSDAFFDLLKVHGKQASQAASLDGTVVIRLGGTVYRW